MNTFDLKPAILATHLPHMTEVRRFTRAVAAHWSLPDSIPNHNINNYGR